MKCSNCNNNVRKEWNYCPNCGARLGVFNVVNSILKKFVKGSKSNINIKVVKKPVKKKRKSKKRFLTKVGEGLEIVEPEVEVEEAGQGYKKVIMELPGVNNPEQINIRRADESLEVNALTNNKRYFKILNFKGVKVLKKRLKEEELTLLVK